MKGKPMIKKPCPDLVKKAGADLLMAVRLGERFAAQARKAKVKAVFVDGVQVE